MPDRLWMPSEYHDEIIPLMRAAPSDWIIKLPGDAYALDFAEPEVAEEQGREPRILSEGQIVKFSWREIHHQAELTVSRDGTWSVDQPPPASADGLVLVWDLQETESTCEGLQDMARHIIECWDWYATDNNDVRVNVRIEYFVWSDGSVDFTFRNDAFLPTALGAGNA